jgi:hypothetical protein
MATSLRGGGGARIVVAGAALAVFGVILP